MKTLTNKKIFIAPYSPISKALASEFCESNVLGFIDRNEEGENIYKIDDIRYYDYIFIYSPNHYKAIYDEYISKGVDKSKIVIVTKGKDDYIFNQNKSIFFIKESLKDYSKKTIQSLSQKDYLKKDRVLLVAPDFVDLNIKYLFLYMIQKEIDVYLATDNKQHYEIFKKISNRVLLYPSLEYFRVAITSKIKVIDRIVTNDVIKTSLSGSFLLQLWHGIALKRLNNMNSGLHLNGVVSTSKWATENNFSKFLISDEYIESGYPRCDVFKRELDPYDYTLTDKDTNTYIYRNKENKVVVYMPTFRENSFEKSPLDFEKLNDFCIENSLIFVVKMHPFDLLKYFDTLKEVKLSNVIFYKAGYDIYPLLKRCDILVSDYSSVYFDFLLANKPIIHFVYDKEEYVDARGEFMLDFDEFVAGDLALNYDELLSSILNNLKEDKYIQKREKLKELLYDNNSLACERLYSYIKGKLDEA
jgi:CDP-glycerol glycerophosphotransferase (TagB/SpsB family)